MLNERKLPQAFVVQFHAGTDPTADRFRGRVEHVASGEARRFDALEELLGFLKQQLLEAAMERSSEG